MFGNWEREIGFTVGDMLEGIELPMGSVVLVGSVSDLAGQGVSGYSDELARTLRILKERLGQQVQVAALPPVLLGGVNCPTLVRNIIEIEHWAERLEGGDGLLLRKTRVAVVESMAEQGIGGVSKPEVNFYCMPKGVLTKDKVKYRSIGWVNSPEMVEPLSEKNEKKIVESLVEELRVNFGARLSRHLCLDRESKGGNVQIKYLVVGASNAGRLSDVMARLGKDVVKVTKGGWRPTRQGVEEMVELLEGKVETDSVVIFLGMDNAMFYEEDDDGERTLPSADKEKKYHIEGRLEVASGRHAKGLVANLGPIWEKVGDVRKVLLSPLVRYFRTKCCAELGHCTNMGLPSFRKNLLSDLSEVNEAMREACLEGGLKRFRVANLNEYLDLSP